MNHESLRAQPPLEFIPPAYNPLVLQAAQAILPLWLKLRTNITEIEASQAENLAKLYHQFQQGKIRFLIAFRHPHTYDPFCLCHLLWQLVPQTARQQGIVVDTPVHAHFIYDRGIPLWAGSWVGWLYAHLGGTPIRRGKLDLVGLRSARELFANGDLPMAAAPEGATNGHNEIVSPLEPGIAQLGFWCVEDLHKAGRSEQVLIVPIGIKYHYLTPPWDALEDLLTQLEKDSGLTAQVQPEVASSLIPEAVTGLSEREKKLYGRLYRLGEHLLSVMEEFYTEFYHCELSPDSATENTSKTSLSTRLDNLLNAALQVAEEFFALEPKGSIIDRCRRLEQAGWDYIYREEIKSTPKISPLERGLADIVAEEASLRMWHMRVVESFVAVTGHYVREKPTVERFAETTLLLWDLVARIRGKNPFARPQLGQQRVHLTVGEPISVSDRWHDYQDSRRQAIATLTADLAQALAKAIAS